MSTIDISTDQTLADLVRRAASGEDIVIRDGNVDVARIVPEPAGEAYANRDEWPKTAEEVTAKYSSLTRPARDQSGDVQETIRQETEAAEEAWVADAERGRDRSIP